MGKTKKKAQPQTRAARSANAASAQPESVQPPSLAAPPRPKRANSTRRGNSAEFAQILEQQKTLMQEVVALRSQVATRPAASAANGSAATSSASAGFAGFAGASQTPPTPQIPVMDPYAGVDLTGQSDHITPFISVTHDIDNHVPNNIKSKIAKSEYIDLAFLLEGSIDITRPNIYSLNLNIGEADTGNITLKSPGPKRRIDNIQNWTDAFIVFTYIYLQTHPEKQRELLVYMRTIRRAATFGAGFKLYDLQFRLQQQNSPARSWASLDSELWIVYVLGSKSTTPTPFRPTPGGSQPSGATRPSIPSGVCFNFNKSQGCPLPKDKCRYKHECGKCAGKTHNLQSCTLAQKK